MPDNLRMNITVSLAILLKAKYMLVFSSIRDNRVRNYGTIADGRHLIALKDEITCWVRVEKREASIGVS